MSATLRGAALVFVAALVQVSALAGADIDGVAPDVLLVVVVLLAWSRGSVAGAWAGFAGGLLVDTATLERLGVTSLLLLLVGYWAGRYAETTGRGRAFAPYLTVFVLAALHGVAASGLAALLGESVDAGSAIGVSMLAALLDTGVALLLYRPVRRALGGAPRQAPSQGVEAVG